MQLPVLPVSVSRFVVRRLTYLTEYPPDNLRFVFEPSAVAYPTTPEDVSSIIQAGIDNNLQVVARGGGVSIIS